MSKDEDKPLLKKWLALKRASSDQRLAGADLRVLVAVMDRMNEQMESWPGYTTIASDICVSRRTATRSVERLVKLGYIAKTSGGMRKANRYKLNQLSAISPIDQDDTRDEDDTPLVTIWSPALSVNVTPELIPLNLKKEPIQENAASTLDNEVVKAYHDHCPMLPKVVTVTGTRKKAIKFRHNGLMDQCLDSWAKYFKRVANSDFLTGKCPASEGRSKPFVAKFDWLINETNMVKVLEGNYDNGESREPRSPSQRLLNGPTVAPASR